MDKKDHFKLKIKEKKYIQIAKYMICVRKLTFIETLKIFKKSAQH